MSDDKVLLSFWAYWKKKRENLILTVTHLPLTASLLQFDRDQGRVFNRQDQGHFRQTLIQDSLTRGEDNTMHLALSA